MFVPLLSVGMVPHHRCSRCAQVKPTKEFPFAKEVRHSWCRECHREVARHKYAEWRRVTPRKFRTAEDYTTADGKMLCSKCSGAFPVEHYQRGKPGWCRVCRAVLEASRRRSVGMAIRPSSRLENGLKLCLTCQCMKELNTFYQAKRGLGGVAAYCKECSRLRYKDPAKSRASTAAYRLRHRERHLAAHRIHQWNRKNSCKASSDGSVTTELVKDLYGSSMCHYCGSSTPREKRTLDHRTPLSKGGEHTACNVVMACWTCNCSKGGKTEEEFKLYKERKHNDKITNNKALSKP